MDKVRNNKDANFGFDAESGEYLDMFKAGILDPVKVTRSALQNASSIAGLLLITEVLVTDLPEKKQPMMGGSGAGMPPMDY